MTNNERELWNNIKAFQFDKPNTTVTFAKRFARENGFSEQFANSIIDEYRKFIFLCCVSTEQVSPSYFVDLAWHLHLTHTKSYWTDLCRNTIDRDLHHNPTEGGREEDQKFANLYKCTLELYELYFQSKAPDNIWPDNNERPKNPVGVIERSRFWVIPKPAFSLGRRKHSASLGALLLASVVFGCSAFSGSFPIILIILLILGVVLLLAWRHNRQSNRDGGSGCGSSGCGSDGRNDSDSGDASDGGGDSGCSSGCSGGCGGGGD